MATSLATQLKKLQAPQTNLLLVKKKRASLLFDPSEAANLDKETVFEIGQNGLEELIKLCKLFDQFKLHLFARSSIGLERSVHDVALNKSLNNRIGHFLILLSPYFLLSPAQKTLEWLIHRFHIHQFNKDQFMMLILPYHETRMFVRALQLIDLTDPADKWNWLQPLQKPGVPLSIKVLINHVASDTGFLKLICQHVCEATKVYGDQGSCLGTLFAFYTMSVTGAIDHLNQVTENHMTHLLPVLKKGFRSRFPDFEASSYMVATKILTKVKLNDNTTNYLLSTMLTDPSLRHEVVLLTLLAYDKQLTHVDSIPVKLITKLSNLSWFPEMLANVKSSGVNVLNFTLLLLASSVRYIQENKCDSVQTVGTMIEQIANNVSFNTDEITAVLEKVVRLHVSVTEMEKKSVKFLVNFFHSLERKYPANFDSYLEKLVRDGSTNVESQKIVELLMSWHEDAENIQGTMQILDRLCDVNPQKRIAGLKLLADNEIQVSENYREMINDALLARFRDDDEEVVLTLLNFPLNRLATIFTTDVLIDELLRLVSKTNPYSPSIFGIPALRILLSLCSRNDTRVFITVLPYLFPRTKSEVKVSMEVLKSDYAKNNNYMEKVRIDAYKHQNGESIAAAAFHRILDIRLLPSASSILSTLKEQETYDNAANVFFSMILLGSVCRVPVGSLPHAIAKDIITIASKVVREHPNVQLLPNCNQLNGDKIVEALELASNGILPLQVGTYVLETVHRRLDLSANPVLDFEDDPDRSELVLHFLEIYFHGIMHRQWRSHYLWCLKIFLKRHFTKSEDAICFLSQLFSKPVSPQTSLHCLQIALSLLESNNSLSWTYENCTFVPNLLIALTNENIDCRRSAIKILEKLFNTFNITTNGFATLLRELAMKKTEIEMDHQQLSLILYTLLSPDPDVQSQLSSKLKAQLGKALNMLLATLTETKTPIHEVAQLLGLLSHVTDAQIFKRLAPIGINLLQRIKTQSKYCKFAADALRNILERFDVSTIKALKDDEVWLFFETGMRDYTSKILVNQEFLPPSIIIMRQIDDNFFAHIGKWAKNRQSMLLACLIDTVTDCEISSVVSVCNKVVHRIKLDAELIVQELKLMLEAKATENEDEPKRKKHVVVALNPAIVYSRAWRRGITLLEFVQRVNNVEQKVLLVPILFDLLRLSLKFEEQSSLEYTKQLLLSTIHRLATESVPIEKAHLHVDLIAECIRTSPNPQTHHHALLVLVELFKIADLERALHNIMSIFTFMGSSVLRQDDAYSIQIISKTIETIVPVINAAENELHACGILRVFVTSLPDIPEHRRGPLFVKLLQLLENHLHLFFLLTFESHVLSQAAKGSETSLQKLEFALSIAQEFSPQRLIQVCTKLIEFARALPIEIDERRGRSHISFSGNHIFNVNNNSAKQLRHYKYTLVQFLSALLSSSEFMNKVAELDDAESRTLQNYHYKLIVQIVKFIQISSTCVDRHQGKPTAKYWRVLVHWLYEVLDKVNSLLPNDVFVQSILLLIEHDSVSIRRKALELLNVRLQQKKFTQADRTVLSALIQPLMEILNAAGKAPSQEIEVIEQTALVTFKLLARSLATEDPTTFKPVLELTTKLIQTRDGPVLGSAVLCLAELCATMRTHAIQSLNSYVPALINLLRTKCCDENPDIVVLSIVSALQKIVEALGNFLSLYLDQLLVELSKLRSRYVDPEHPKIGPIIQRLKTTTQKLSTCMPLRILLPTVSDTYDKLISKGFYNCVEPLMNVLSDAFANAQPAELNAAIQDLAAFFLRVLQFREDFVPQENMDGSTSDVETLNVITLVEESASQALVKLVLRLSEATFRPLYYRLYDWAARNPSKRLRNITFYRLSANIAECLKSLFVLFAAHFLKHAASLLTSNNPFVDHAADDQSTMPLESQKIEVINAILLTLYRVFMYDPHNFINEERFQTLSQPLLDQLENMIGTVEDYEKRAKELIIPCIANFAGAIQDDSLHRQLVYQTLLKTRHDKSHVRNSALNAIVEIAKKLGDDFMPLLPETVPFLAELLEDEDEEIEKLAQEAVRTLEEVLNEPLQKYF